MTANLSWINTVKKSYIFCMAIMIIYFLTAYLQIKDSYGDFKEYIINIFNAAGFHWLIISVYLYWLYKNDDIFFHNYSKIRYVTKSNLFMCRINLLLVQTLYFILPFWIFSIITAYLTQNQIFLVPIILGLWNLSIGIMVIGFFVTVLNSLQKNILVNYIFILILLTIDILATIGMINFETNLVYSQLLSVQFYLKGQDTGKILMMTFILLIKLTCICILGLFTQSKELRNYIFRNIHGQYYLRVLYAIPLGLLFGVYYGRSAKTLTNFLVGVFGGNVSFDGDPISLILFTLPLIMNLFLFIDILHNDRNTAAVYIFTRRKTRTLWFIQKSITVLSCSLLFFIFLFASSLILPLIFGVQVGTSKTFFCVICSLIFTYVAYNIMISLIANILCLKYRHIFVFVYMLFLHLFGLLVPEMIPKRYVNLFVYLYPSTQSSLGWHDILSIRWDLPDYFFHAVAGFSVWKSAAYIIIFISLIMIISIRKIQDLDFLTNK